MDNLIVNKKYKNRYNDEYWFQEVQENLFEVKGDLKYWRLGGEMNEDRTGFTKIDFADPSGGPYMAVGMRLFDREVLEIIDKDNSIYLRLQEI